MNNRIPPKIVDKFSDECIQCGVCLNSCDLLNELGMTPGEIAQAMLHGDVDEKLVAAVQRCALCSCCSEECLVNLNPADLMKSIREQLMQTGTVTPLDFDVMLMDHRWNFFSIYRETFGIQYPDLFKSEYETLFFPGCSLVSYAPDLTRRAYQWLTQQGFKLGFSEMCCGVPLDSIGLPTEADRYLDQLRDQLKSAGARRIITACPHCECFLRSHLPGVDILSIYSLMSDAGFRLEGSTTLTFHDSCPDRHNSKNLETNRLLFSGYPQVEMVSHGENTICCGSGGIVSMVDPELCTCRAQKRIAEISDALADTCLTSCMSCAFRLARVAQPDRVRHILEYLFDTPIDYEKIEANTRAMWEGEIGQLNLWRLSQNEDLRNEARKPSGSS